MSSWISALTEALWGPGTIALLVGVGVFLTVRTRFLAWRNLGWALRSALGREARSCRGGRGDVSPFSALMTALAATVGTGNIVGVATALTAGGPGALVWMEISAAFGLTTKLSECALAVRHRRVDRRGEMCGGPMYVMAQALPFRRLGAAMGGLFALCAVLASFGVGNTVQSNAAAASLHAAFGLPVQLVGAVTAAVTFTVVLGGIGRISRASTLLVPVMAAVYLAAGLWVVLVNWQAVPGALGEMLRLALSPKAAGGGLAGAAVRYGVARGVLSNEAGLGSAAITAASAASDSPVRQGYLQMTGAFFDTTVVCTVTGLAICCSGALGAADPATGLPADGAELTILAFRTGLGPLAGPLIAVCVALFALTSILAWEYQGEKALEYLAGGRGRTAYRLLFALAAFWGAGAELETVFRLGDLFNALMALPNLACLLLLSGDVAREVRAFQPQIGRRRSK